MLPAIEEHTDRFSAEHSSGRIQGRGWRTAPLGAGFPRRVLSIQAGEMLRWPPAWPSPPPQALRRCLGSASSSHARDPGQSSCSKGPALEPGAAQTRTRTSRACQQLTGVQRAIIKRVIGMLYTEQDSVVLPNPLQAHSRMPCIAHGQW